MHSFAPSSRIFCRPILAVALPCALWLNLAMAEETALAPQSAPSSQTENAEERFSAHLQGTYIWQYKPAFRAAYSGANSLVPQREKAYTFTSTAFVGARLWQGAEIYLNGEATQGVPFSNLTGAGSFSNGEFTRTSSTNPVFYRQRLFLRQTLNLGGGREVQEGEANQLAGAVDKNRIVVTLGNFSTLDMFDDNAYAKDPRTQFFNSSHMTYGAYDYAADARGFGWGAAAEWIQGDWAVRFARMSAPKDPNGLAVDDAIHKHYGDQLELEHSHTLAGQPGKIRLLGWRNRMVLARYQDALDLGAATNTTPSINAVRRTEQVKYGFGINLEQALHANLGVFLRAMWADGKTETMAFTEADRSVSVGTAIKGAFWHRPQDTLGLAYAWNGLSSARRQYLEAGGISFFIGDGKLNYRPEQILEAYYSAALFKGTSLSFNFQRMANPAYNADRGPVKFYGVRLHAEY